MSSVHSCEEVEHDYFDAGTGPEKAANLLLKSGVIPEGADLAAFMTSTMAIMMEKLGIENKPGKKYEVKPKVHYKLKTEDADVQEGIEVMNSKTGFELQPIDMVLEGKRIVVTGASRKFSRKRMMELVAEAGGMPSTDVTSLTDYLVVCEKVSIGYRFGTFGNKLRKAADAGVTLVAECDFITALEKAGVLEKKG